MPCRRLSALTFFFMRLAQLDTNSSRVLFQIYRGSTAFASFASTGVRSSRGEPVEDAALRPANAAGAVPAEKAHVTAARHDVQLHGRGFPHTLERFDRDEWVVSSSHNQGA